MDEKYNAGALIDTIIEDCNNAVRAVVSGEYVQFCALIVGMVQKLTTLQNGIAEEARQKDQIIRELGGGGGV